MRMCRLCFVHILLLVDIGINIYNLLFIDIILNFFFLNLMCRLSKKKSDDEIANSQ